jgi:rhodanese-related sulfurtransferase
MNALDSALKEMDFDFLASGEHAMSIEGLRKVLGNEHFLFLDVRSDKELQYVTFPFAIHIPLHNLPARIHELPKDKCIVVFCSSIFRGAVAYTYLRANGFQEVKGLTASMEDMLSIFKPGPLAKI